MKAQWIIVCGLFLALLTAIVAVFNTDNVTLSYGVGELQVSLIIVIAAAVLLGGLIVAIFGTSRPYRWHKEKEALRHDNEALKEEAHSLQMKVEGLRAEKAELLEKLARAETRADVEAYENLSSDRSLISELPPEESSTNGHSAIELSEEEEEQLRHRTPKE